MLVHVPIYQYIRRVILDFADIITITDYCADTNKTYVLNMLNLSFL